MSTKNPQNVVTPTTRKPGELDPVMACFDLPQGRLEIHYRLTKGPRLDPASCSYSYGVNPETNERESRFETDDKAVLEVKVVNASDHNLKRVHFKEIRLAEMNADHSVGAPANGMRPDGNLYFEIVPDDTYFGDVERRGTSTKYLSLITRGVKAGPYAVQADVLYDIEEFERPVVLELEVKKD